MKRLPVTKVGMALPTCYPDRFMTEFVPSLQHLQSMNGMLKFLLNLQPPFDNKAAKRAVKAIKEFGFEVDYDLRTKPYSKPFRMKLARAHAAAIDPDLSVYMLVDDDMVFRPKSDRKMLHCLDYVHRFKRCGAVSCRSFLGGYIQKEKIAPVLKTRLGTFRGAFLKSFKELWGYPTLPKEAQMVRGSGDRLNFYLRIENGYFVGKQVNNPTQHKFTKLYTLDGKKVKDFEKLARGLDTFKSPDVMKHGIIEMVRARYDAPNWDPWNDVKTFPKKLLELYTENNGPDIENEKYIIDYKDVLIPKKPVTVTYLEDLLAKDL